MNEQTPTILCVEDEPVILADIVDELRDAGYHVAAARDGNEAMKFLQKKTPDLVISDINMPSINGLQLLEMLRSSKMEAADVPFIFLTAYGDRSDVITGRKLGADDYLVKPIDFDLLLTTVESRLQGVRRARRALEARIKELEQRYEDYMAQMAGQELEHRDALQRELTDSSRAWALVLAQPTGLARLRQKFGPEAAEGALQEFLTSLRSAPVPGTPRLFQIGSNVFGALVEDSPNAGALQNFADGLAEYRPTQAAQGVLEASVVLARHRPAAAESAAQLIDEALLALHYGRDDGQPGAIVLDEPSVHRMRILQHVERHLARALVEGEMHLNFQPQVRASDGQIVGVEALIRWLSPEYGPISPGLFIPLAERVGMIQLVSDWVLDHAAAATRQLLDAGFPISVSINAAAAELRDNFVDRVISTLERHRVPPLHFEIEITETSMVRDLEFAGAITQRLRQAGVRVAVDDFGTGYASLAYLRALNLDTVKIDRSFLDGIDRSPLSRRIVESIVSLARGIGLTSVAEGVETPAQLVTLKEIGCDVVQGFLLAEPCTLDELLKRLPRPAA
jgi:EAL domain-containing protein (putative c-di-GMP-specific phosphodiesterase class I)/DNA-binding response OmpR family regulator